MLPECGFIFKNIKYVEFNPTLIPFVGTDPDSQTNVWHWEQAQGKWLISFDDYDAAQSNTKGPFHSVQFCPIGFKDQINTMSSYNTYTYTSPSRHVEKQRIKC